ncbi:uncharacterized protein LOC142319322 [Lycorma delicatula]|uniref:uncharacterized protein LOC142319322 n=1 Tax=Lycorma delicatula TaxID=130591 RepID=UPI003F5143E8
MAYLSTKLAVKDNYEDDDVSDDVDDEVFIRDGRNGYKVDEERGVKRPLMAPRRKIKGNNHFHMETCKKPPCSTFCAPCCYGFIALCALLGLIVLVTMVVNMFPLPLERIRSWTVGPAKKEKTIIPCTEINTQEVWAKIFPKLVSEAPIKITDVNGDGIDDVIIGYGTGADDIEMTGVSCEKYFGHAMNEPCMGGVMALNGQTGEKLWQHWTTRSVLYVDCSTDITNDNVNDCLISGKGGILQILHGKTGDVIWEIIKPDENAGVNIDTGVNVYTAQFISDVDSDGIPDILAAHTSNSISHPAKFEGHLIVYSGKTKSLISQVLTPGNQSILDAPQVLVSPDGTRTVVFTTGDVASHGNTYCVHLHDVLKENMSKHILLSSNGNSVSPVLVDMNMDGTEDIVTANGAYISVYDGRTLNQLWNTSVTSTNINLLNTYISPTPAYFNDDLIPDILVIQLAGPDILSIYNTQISVLDGENGQNLLEQVIIGSGAVDSPAITLSYKGIGNDYFLFWHSVCIGHENDDQPYYIFRGNANVREQSRTDFCRIRFNSSTEMRLYALSQHLEPPGVLLYSTKLKWDFEHNDTERAGETQTFLESNSQSVPPLLNNYRRKGLAPPSYHYNNINHKSRLQYPPQDMNPATFDKVQPNYPYYQNRADTMQGQWPPAVPESLLDPSTFNGDIYRGSVDTNSQRLLPSLFKNIGEMGQDMYDTYNEENDDILRNPPVSDRDRDERESMQEMNDKLHEQDSTKQIKTGEKIKRTIFHNLKKRMITDKNKKLSIPRVTAAASLAPSTNNMNGIDIIFATHWVPASERNMILLTPADLQCINTKLKTSETAKFQDTEELRETLAEECINERGLINNNIEDNILRINRGQLIIYRIHLNCNCTNLNTDSEICSQPLSFNRQSWPNWGGNSYYKSRQSPHYKSRQSPHYKSRQSPQQEKYLLY